MKEEVKQEEIFKRLNLLMEKELAIYKEIDECLEELKSVIPESKKIADIIRCSVSNGDRLIKLIRFNYPGEKHISAIEDFKTLDDIFTFKPRSDITFVDFDVI